MSRTRFDQRSNTEPTGRPRRRAAEQGSAFTVALLVLLVLTISGLAVTLMTQTEVRIGANERTANRSLYAADSGVEVATARKLYIGPAYATSSFNINTSLQDTGLVAGTGGATFADQVTITPLIPLAVQYCNLCKVNQGMAQSYSYIVYVVNSTAVRNGLVGSGVDPTVAQTVATKLLGATIGMQPQPSGDAVNPFAAQISVQF